MNGSNIVIDRTVGALDFAARVYMRVRSRVAPLGIGDTVFGFRMYCDTRDFIQRRVFHFRLYEPNLSYYIKSQVDAGSHVVDVGANVGYVTLLLSSIVGDTGKVVAIEASPATYGQLSRNLALNNVKNVVALNMAATSGPCMVEIVAGERNNSGTNSIRHTSHGQGSAVPGDALSNIAEIARDRVAFIKIDVEGSEAPVLQDILDTLDSYPRLTAIAAELTPDSARFFALLQARGFRGYGFPNNYRIGYMLVRQYLRHSYEHGFVVKIPLAAYDPAFRDYVFEREMPPAVQH